jgi:hypothetical protein
MKSGIVAAIRASSTLPMLLPELVLHQGKQTIVRLNLQSIQLILFNDYRNRGTTYAANTQRPGPIPETLRIGTSFVRLAAFHGTGDEIKSHTFAALVLEYVGPPDDTGQYPKLVVQLSGL